MSKLSNLLNQLLQTHRNNILLCNTIKDAHIYSKINQLPGNIYGDLIEYFIQTKYNLQKIHPNKLSGDFKANNCNIELKVSNGGFQHNIFTFSQLRLHHNCDYLLSAYYLSPQNLYRNGDHYLFYLTKQDMINTVNKDVDLSHKQLRIHYDKKKWNQLLRFRIADNDICNL